MKYKIDKLTDYNKNQQKITVHKKCIKTINITKKQQNK